MSRHARYLERATAVAMASECSKQHGAIVVRGSRVLSAGCNLRRNHPRIDYRIATVHAEVAALRGLEDPEGCDVYVARVNRQGDSRLSRPCLRCYQTLVTAGVRRIYYTTNTGWGMEKL